MNQAKEALKAELLAFYSQAIEEMLADCPEKADFAMLEDQIEILASKVLPKTLQKLVDERGISPLSCLSCQSETKAYGRRSTRVLTPWGEASLNVPRRYCLTCQEVRQVLPRGLDDSGLSPKALLRRHLLRLRRHHRHKRPAVQQVSVPRDPE
jgi:hypothetical protein